MQKVRGRLAAPTVRRHTVSGSFHPPFGVLFTFPSRYSFTIGHQVVLSLGRWSSQIPTGLLVPHGTQVPTMESSRFRVRGSHPLRRTFPDASATPAIGNSAPLRQKWPHGPTTPFQQRLPAYTERVWARPRSLAATRGVSVDFCSFGY